MARWVLSGPLLPYKGRGRPFKSVAAAYLWHRRRYPEVKLRVVRESLEPDAMRWALEVFR